MLHIYYGDGKGKTSSLNGSAIRAKGSGWKVGYFKFLKGRYSNEDNILKSTLNDFRAFQSSKKFVISMTPEEKLKTRQEINIGLDYILLNKGNFDIIILDEFIDLQDPTVSLFTVKQLVSFLLKLKDKEVMISGHSLPKEMEDIADLVTNFKAQKHYFNKGVKARAGIEF